MHDFRRLGVWHLATQIVDAAYELSANFPQTEQYALRQQMRRAAVSIPSNIAEGAARSSIADFRRFLFIAKGSAAELETHLAIALQLGYIDAKPADIALRSVRRCQAQLTRPIQSAQLPST
jgi:four helix bundle protein